MRSSLPFWESTYGWFHLVMRDTVKVKCVCELSCASSVTEPCACARRAAVLCVCVWVEFVCVFVSGRRLLLPAPFSCDGLFVRRRHKIIRLVAVCLLKWLELSVPIRQLQGDQLSMAAVWRSLVPRVFEIEGTKLPSVYYVGHVRFH